MIFVQGNLNWMQSRESSLKSSVWRGRENEIRPFGNPKASDSANLDSAAEVRSITYVIVLLIYVIGTLVGSNYLDLNY